MNKNTDYYAPPNPYQNAPSCGIDLLELRGMRGDRVKNYES